MKRIATLGVLAALALPASAAADPAPPFPCSPGTWVMFSQAAGGVAQNPVWAAYERNGHSNGGWTLDELQAAYIERCGYPT